MMRVRVGKLRLRAEPSIGRNIVAELLKDTVLRDVGPRYDNGGYNWGYVEHEGDYGWAALTNSSGYRYMEPYTPTPPPVEPDPPAVAPKVDYFEAPIGEERGEIWPAGWVDVNPIRTRYLLRGEYYAYHTGADLNKNTPHWDADRDAPVYSIAHGLVIAAGEYGAWGNLVVIKHEREERTAVYSRYGHLGEMTVYEGEIINRGDKIGTVGQDASGGPFHLHFDISLTDILAEKPNDWPGGNLSRVERDYVDPKQFLQDNGNGN